MRLASILASTLAFFNASASMSPVALDEVKSCIVSIFHSSEELDYNTAFFKKSLSEKVKSNITYGTGFIYKDFIVTNFHVLEQAIKNKYKIFGCNNKSCIELNVLAIDKEIDLAMLNTSQDFGCSKKFEFNINSNEGDEVVIYGNKFGLGGSFAFGHISAINKTVAENEVYNFIDANVGYGNSGAPILSTKNEIIGILKSIYSPYGGGNSIVFGITPVNSIKSLDKMSDMLEFEKMMEFEILEENDEIYFVPNNENVYFEKLPFSKKIQIQSINKKFVSSKIEVLHDIYNFVISDEEVLRLTQITKDRKLRNITIKKQSRIGDASILPQTAK